MLYRRGVVYWTKFNHRGRTYRLSTGARTRANALRAEALLKAQVIRETGAELPPGRPRSVAGLVRDLAGEHLDLIRGRGRAAPYVASIEIGWRHLLTHFGADAVISDLTHDRIAAYEIGRRQEGARGQTIRRELWQLRWAFRSAQRKGWIDAMPEFPAVDRDPPHATRRGRLVPPKILRAILRELDREARDRLMVIALTGLRATEAMKLTGAWLEGRKGARFIRVPAAAAKSRRERLIPCPSHAAAILVRRRGLLGSEVPLFPVTSHKTQLRRVCRDIGVERITLRDLRTTFASEALAATGDAAAVQDILGHHDLSMTQVYQRSTVKRLRKAARGVEAALLGTVRKKNRAQRFHRARITQ